MHLLLGGVPRVVQYAQNHIPNHGFHSARDTSRDLDFRPHSPRSRPLRQYPRRLPVQIPTPLQGQTLEAVDCTARTRSPKKVLCTSKYASCPGCRAGLRLQASAIGRAEPRAIRLSSPVTCLICLMPFERLAGCSLLCELTLIALSKDGTFVRTLPAGSMHCTNAPDEIIHCGRCRSVYVILRASSIISSIIMYGS